MKTLKKIILIIFTITLSTLILMPSEVHQTGLVFAKTNSSVIEQKENSSTKQAPMLAIVIDDFGGYDRSGVKTMLSIPIPLTCAIMPNLDYTTEDMENAVKSSKEVILHMPMQSHVNLPADWYGPVYIYNTDTPAEATAKLDSCLSNVHQAKGFNIHIGSGVSQNRTLMKAILSYAKEHGLYFLDSRTHVNTIGDVVAKENNYVYMGRDEFLEPDHNKSYANVKSHLLKAAQTAKEKGYAIAIGHVGAHGGENTANAIKDTFKEIRESGVELVYLSDIYKKLNGTTVSTEH